MLILLEWPVQTFRFPICLFELINGLEHANRHDKYILPSNLFIEIYLWKKSAKSFQNYFLTFPGWDPGKEPLSVPASSTLAFFEGGCCSSYWSSPFPSSSSSSWYSSSSNCRTTGGLYHLSWLARAALEKGYEKNMPNIVNGFLTHLAAACLAAFLFFPWISNCWHYSHQMSANKKESRDNLQFQKRSGRPHQQT